MQVALRKVLGIEWRLIMLSINEINLLQAQNEGLKKQNAELQKEIERRDNVLLEIKQIAESAINRRPHSDNTIFNKILTAFDKAEEE